MGTGVSSQENYQRYGSDPFSWSLSAGKRKEGIIDTNSFDSFLYEFLDCGYNTNEVMNGAGESVWLLQTLFNLS